MNPNLYKDVLKGSHTPQNMDVFYSTAVSSINPATVLTPVTSLVQNLQGTSLQVENSNRRLSCDSLASDSDTSLSFPTVCGALLEDDTLSISPFVCAARKDPSSSIPPASDSPIIAASRNGKQFLPRKSSKRILFDCASTGHTPGSKNLSSGSSFSMFSSTSKENFVPPGSQASNKVNSQQDENCDPISDAFLEEFLCVPSEMDDTKSTTVNSLMSLPLSSWNAESPKQPKGSRVAIRRCLSMFDNSTPLSTRSKKSRLPPCSNELSTTPIRSPRPMTPPVNKKKRSASPVASDTETNPKRAKYNDDAIPGPSSSQGVTKSISGPPLLQRCLSESHISIMRALTKSTDSEGEQLTGDFSRPMALPLLNGGRHPDLRTIDVHTMAGLLRGNYKDKVATFSIMDCRYPYEYEGGHIQGALNWPHPRHVHEFLNRQTGLPVIPQESGLRHIFVFHCEFSAERGPRALRLLRELDRTASEDQYPALYFPELYLLEGGYKAFYHNYPELCDPFNYVKMVDENHSEDCKMFRAQSKSWATENKHGKLKSIISRNGSKHFL